MFPFASASSPNSDLLNVVQPSSRLFGDEDEFLDDTRNVESLDDRGSAPKQIMEVTEINESSHDDVSSPHEEVVETHVIISNDVAVPNEATTQLRHSEREKKLPSHLNDYILHSTRCSTDPPPLSPAHHPSSSSNQGTVLYPISSYVTCDKFSASQRAFLAAITDAYEPTSYAEAIKDERWRNAMTGEVTALEDNDTWDITDLPPGKTVIGCR